MSKSDPETTIEVFVRASAIGEVVEDPIETLRRYEESGKVDTIRVRTWPDKIQFSEQITDDLVERLYEEFLEWASDADCSLGPAFRLSERTTLVTERVDTTLTLPVLCMAVRVDDELVSVVPHRTTTGVYTVTDALADVSEGDITHSSVEFGDGGEAASL